MGDGRTARYWWRLPKGEIMKTADEAPPMHSAKPIMATYTLTHRPGGMKHLVRTTKRQLKESRHG